MESSDITSGLPDDYVTHGFTSLSRLNVEAQRVLEGLNQSDDAGNQYILVLNMPRAIRSQLDENKNVLQGINFRLMFDGTTALIKIVPSEPHETATSRLRDNISVSGVLAGTSMDDILWSGKTTHRPSVAANKGKQADDCFIPPTRQPRGNQPQGWPSLVIETGVPLVLSLPRVIRTQLGVQQECLAGDLVSIHVRGKGLPLTGLPHAKAQ
jgi:hypothetical protein